MTTIKDRLLVGIARKRRVANPRDLELDAQTGQHAIVHVLYSLNKQGLVGFHEKKRGNMRVPTKIFLTPSGKKAARRAQR